MVEQGTENPRVGSSILSLATSLAVTVLATLLAGCASLSGPEAVGLFEDDCEATCRVTGRELGRCLSDDDWAALGASGAADWRTTCQDDWSELRRGLSDLERQQALESCEAMLALSRDAACETLAELYLP